MEGGRVIGKGTWWWEEGWRRGKSMRKAKGWGNGIYGKA